MGSTSQAQPASVRRCPGAAGPQYSMYPVDIRCAQPNGEYPFGSKMVPCTQAPTGAVHTTGGGSCAAHVSGVLRTRLGGEKVLPDP